MEIYQKPEIIAHTQLLLKSYLHWTGKNLLFNNDGPLSASETLFNAPFAVLSHGTQADPILNYGNGQVLRLWEIDWAELTSTPSRLTAEPDLRETREKLLAEVSEKGFIDYYEGVRISRSGKRFLIQQATVWNLIDPSGEYRGQAATFKSWRPL